MIGLEILASLTGLIAILQSWKASQGQLQSGKRDAAQALNDAVSATRRVVGRGNGSDTTNYELTSLWFKASLAFRNAKEVELSQLCMIKGEYWTDPTKWTQDQANQADISLERMGRELKRILSDE